MTIMIMTRIFGENTLGLGLFEDVVVVVVAAADGLAAGRGSCVIIITRTCGTGLITIDDVSCIVDWLDTKRGTCNYVAIWSV